MARFPALPLWTDAWVADTKHLNRCERGTYLDLLILMWRSPECQVPNDNAWLAKHLGMSENEVSTDLRPLVVEFCISTGNTLTQKRLLREWEWCKRKSARASVQAKARWHNKKDLWIGNAALQCSLPTPTPLSNKNTYSGGKIPPNAKKCKKQETTLPEDWGPTAPHYAYGKKKGLTVDDVDDLAIGMRAWALANGVLKTNWFEMFMGWINNNHAKMKTNARPNGRQVGGFNGQRNGGGGGSVKEQRVQRNADIERALDAAVLRERDRVVSAALPALPGCDKDGRTDRGHH